MRLLKLRIIAGDFPPDSQIRVGPSTSVLFYPNGPVNGVCLNGNLASVQMLTEEQSKNMLRSVAWGVVGWAVFGLIGAAAGVMKGSNNKEVCFACQLKDGRKFMALSGIKAYQEIAALAL